MTLQISKAEWAVSEGTREAVGGFIICTTEPEDNR